MLKRTTRWMLAGLAALWLPVAQADLDGIRQAAEAGDARAQLELGILFEYGFNFKDNEIPALTWYMLAADQGNPRAAHQRDALIKRMDAAAVAEAEDQAKRYRETRAKQAKPAALMETPAPAPTETVAPAPVPEAPVAPPAQ